MFYFRNIHKNHDTEIVILYLRFLVYSVPLIEVARSNIKFALYSWQHKIKLDENVFRKNDSDKHAHELLCCLGDQVICFFPCALCYGLGLVFLVYHRYEGMSNIISKRMWLHRSRFTEAWYFYINVERISWLYNTI